MKTIRLLFFFTVWSFIFKNGLNSQELPSALVQDDILIIESTGTAFLGSGITEDDAKTLSMNDAKRIALEKAGTYLESNTTVLNYSVVKDEIISFTGGLLKSNILEEKRVIINNMFAVQIRIQATIDTKLLNQRIADVRNDNKFRRQLEIERERIRQLEIQIAELKVDYGRDAGKKIKRTIKLLTASDWIQAGIETNDKNQKLKFFSKAIQIDPNYSYAYAHRASVYDDLGQYQNAMKDYDQAISLDPNFAQVFVNRGIIYHKIGKYYEAIVDFNHAIKVDPNIAEAYNNRGTSYRELGNYENALKDYFQAIKLDSDNAIFYYGRAIIYRKINELDNAMEDLRKAISINPQYADAYCERGKVYHLLEKQNYALQDYNTALSINPKDGYAYFFRAVLYQSIGQNEQAAKDYNRYLELNGDRDGQADNVRKWIRDLGHKPNY